MTDCLYRFVPRNRAAKELKISEAELERRIARGDLGVVKKGKAEMIAIPEWPAMSRFEKFFSGHSGSSSSPMRFHGIRPPGIKLF